MVEGVSGTEGQPQKNMALGGRMLALPPYNLSAVGSSIDKIVWGVGGGGYKSSRNVWAAPRRLRGVAVINGRMPSKAYVLSYRPFPPKQRNLGRGQRSLLRVFRAAPSLTTM